MHANKPEKKRSSAENVAIHVLHGWYLNGINSVRCNFGLHLNDYQPFKV